MNAVRMIAALCASLVVGSAAAGDKSLRYWGKQGGSTGWLQEGDEVLREVAPGTIVPSWGRVKEVREDRIIIERLLSDAERDELEAKGAVPYDTLEIHLPREDVRLRPSIPVTPRRP